jgi:hydroxypyruvate isomerase
MAACQSIHPELWIGCEYRPKARTEAGLGWIDAYT